MSVQQERRGAVSRRRQASYLRESDWHSEAVVYTPRDWLDKLLTWKWPPKMGLTRVTEWLKVRDAWHNDPCLTCFPVLSAQLCNAVESLERWHYSVCPDGLGEVSSWRFSERSAFYRGPLND